MKKLLTSILLASFLLVLSGCGSADTSEAAPVVNPIDLSIEISVDLEDARDDGFENMAETDFIAEEGATVLEATQLYCMANDIPLTLGSDEITVEEINGLEAGQYGEDTGWIFLVNGERPSEDASQISLEDQDKITWEFIALESLS